MCFRPETAAPSSPAKAEMSTGPVVDRSTIRAVAPVIVGRGIHSERHQDLGRVIVSTLRHIGEIALFQTRGTGKFNEW